MSSEHSLLALCSRADWDGARALLRRGVAASQLDEADAADGLTPLLHACLDGPVDVVRLLLLAGADASAADHEGTSPLHVAAMLSKPDVMEVILTAAAVAPDVNAKDESGQTALHAAVDVSAEFEAAALECVRTLLKYGASSGVKDANGRSPRQLARLPALRAALKAPPPTGLEKVRRWCGGQGRRGGEEMARAGTGGAGGRKAGREDEAEEEAMRRGRGVAEARKGGVDEGSSMRSAGERRKGGSEEGSSMRSAGERRKGGSEEGSSMRSAGERRKGGSEEGSSMRRRRPAAGAAGGGACGPPALEAAEEEWLREEAHAEAMGTEEWDVALELLPAYAAVEVEAEEVEAAGEAVEVEWTRAKLLRHLSAPSAALRLKLLHHPAAGHAYLLVGAAPARLAREAERICLPIQLAPQLERRVSAAADDDDAAAAAAARGGEREGGDEAYAPYVRRVHDLFQRAAPPRFFSCAQRSRLLLSIMQAPLDEGGCGVSLADLQRRLVVAQTYPLHSDDERRALEGAWSMASSMALAPAPIAQLHNYLGPEFALYFAFLRLYSLWLWAPAVAGLVLAVFQESEYSSGQSVWQSYYSLAMTVWSQAALLHWGRVHATLTYQWGVAPLDQPLTTPRADPKHTRERPQFRGARLSSGFYLPSDHFVGVEPHVVPEGEPLQIVPRFPWRERTGRLALSWCCLLLCMASTILLQLGLLAVRTQFLAEADDPFWAHYGFALLSALPVEALHHCFGPLVTRLLAAQNHRSRAVYLWHHAVQLFSLLFVNRFFTPVYIASLKSLGELHLFGSRHAEVCRSRGGAPTGECVDELGAQMGALWLISFLVQNGLELAAMRAARRRASSHPHAARRAAHEAALPPPPPFGDEFVELAMSFAMVSLFAGAFPLAAALALAGNGLEGRIDTEKMLRCRQRPHADEVAGALGVWAGVLRGVALLAIACNSLMVGRTSTALPHALGRPEGEGDYGLVLALEHALLLAVAVAAVVVADVPARAVVAAARQRRIVEMVAAARGKAAAGEGRRDAALGEGELEVEEDALYEAEVGEQRRAPALSASDDPADVAVRPTLVELQSDLKEAQEDAKAASTARRRRYLERRSSAAVEPQRRRSSVALERRESEGALVSRVSWTPFRALSRASDGTARASDVGCLLPVLLLWIAMLTVALVGARLGYPPRLKWGVDFELSTCGAANGSPRELRFDDERHPHFPYAREFANAAWAPTVDNHTRPATPLRLGARDLAPADGDWRFPGRGSRSLLYVADPSRSLGVCVSSCPSPSTIADGFAAASLQCTYQFDSASEANRSAQLGNFCFPVYRSTAIAGRCVPLAPAEQSEYDAAAAQVGWTFSASSLRDLRSKLLSSEWRDDRFYAASVGDLITVWPLLLLVALLSPFLAGCSVWYVIRYPLASLAVAFTTSVCALSGVAMVCLLGGQERLNVQQHSSGWVEASGNALRVSAFILFALVGFGGASLHSLYMNCKEAFAMLHVAEVMLAQAPWALLPCVIGAMAQALFLLVWLVSASYIASSDKLEVNEHGFASGLTSSPLHGWIWLYIVGGVWTSGCIANLSHIGVVDHLSRLYWHGAEARRGAPAATIASRLLHPFPHLGSAALGAIAFPLLNPINFWANLFDLDLHWVEHWQESGFVSVALFGVGVKAGGAFGCHITRRLLPHLLPMQAKCAFLFLLHKLAVASTACCVAAIILISLPEYTIHFADDAALTDFLVPIVVLFYYAFLTAAQFTSVIDAALSVAAQCWCLDYKQNCQDLFGEHWMLAVHEATGLEELHAFFMEQLVEQEKANSLSTKPRRRSESNRDTLESVEEGRAPKRRQRNADDEGKEAHKHGKASKDSRDEKRNENRHRPKDRPIGKDGKDEKRVQPRTRPRACTDNDVEISENAAGPGNEKGRRHRQGSTEQDPAATAKPPKEKRGRGSEGGAVRKPPSTTRPGTGQRVQDERGDDGANVDLDVDKSKRTVLGASGIQNVAQPARRQDDLDVDATKKSVLDASGVPSVKQSSRRRRILPPLEDDFDGVGDARDAGWNEESRGSSDDADGRDSTLKSLAQRVNALTVAKGSLESGTERRRRLQPPTNVNSEAPQEHRRRRPNGG
ncbi:hypothetical protein AB1Y20_007472 [Prymnesium parvum]|uniref:Anoctamin transmembrane domain-containing protein n=1 Tax=Prymnesium parvum TaxID=97485 RepID=A0AB34IX50_PRYPA